MGHLGPMTLIIGFIAGSKSIAFGSNGEFQTLKCSVVPR